MWKEGETREHALLAHTFGVKQSMIVVKEVRLGLCVCER